ncbi:MAG: hypothetical protein AAFY00_01245 [Bacteroidota bacterium]
MRKIVAVFILFCLFAFKCEPEIEFNDNERLSFRGRVVNFTGEGLNGVPIEIIASQTFISSAFPQINLLADEELSGSGFSKENGSFDITSLSPRNADTYTVINPPFSRSYDPNRISFVISSAFQDIEDQIITIPEDIVLDKISDFTVRANRIANLTDTLEYSVRFSPLVIVENVDEFAPLEPVFDTSLEVQLLPAETTSSDVFPMRENDTLIFSYRLSSNGVQKDSVIITSAQNRSFVFEF